MKYSVVASWDCCKKIPYTKWFIKKRNPLLIILETGICLPLGVASSNRKGLPQVFLLGYHNSPSHTARPDDLSIPHKWKLGSTCIAERRRCADHTAQHTVCLYILLSGQLLGKNDGLTDVIQEQSWVLCLQVSETSEPFPNRNLCMEYKTQIKGH